jgi:hypothetical protein
MHTHTYYFLFYSYNIIMITPKIWGPHFWMFFHLISTKYPEKPSELDKSMARELINSIEHILPCKICKKHFKKNIEKFPLDDKDIDSKNKFITWFINFHNTVNISLDKSISTKHNILSLNHNNYWDCFKRVLEYIDHDIGDDVEFRKCQGVKKFIKVALYFGGKKYDDVKIDFHNYETFKNVKKNIFN